jgi:hypothetical protein
VSTPNVEPLESWSQTKFKNMTPINSLQKATKLTRQRMVQEFKITDKVIRGEKGWDTNFFDNYGYYVQVKVIADFRTWFRTVELPIMRLSLNLKAIEHVDAIRSIANHRRLLHRTHNKEVHKGRDAQDQRGH